MRGFMKRVDLFCYKHPRFGVNNLMLYIVFGTSRSGCSAPWTPRA